MTQPDKHPLRGALPEPGATMTIEELVSRSSQLLQLVAPRQTRYKVAQRPDVRTIRYYTNQQLLPRPVSYEGGKARYTRTHLVRLLAIKQMQAAHQTLRQITGALEGLTDDQVLELLAAREPSRPSAPRLRRDPAVAEGVTLRRLHLEPGATLDLPLALLEDPASRQRLAQSLRRLADRLRRTDTDNSDGAEKKGEQP